MQLAQQLLDAEQQEAVLKPMDADRLHEQLDLDLNEEPALEQSFKTALSDLVLNTPRTATHLFYNQLFGGRNGKAVLGDLLAVLLNNSMYTYKVAGPMVGVEKVIIRKSCELAGYPSDSDGTIAPGGSMTNLMAMLMARDHFKLSITREGVTQPMCIYTSEHSHYSIPKNASFIGVGLDRVRKIPTDEKGRMRPEELRKQIVSDLEDGLFPFFVNSTAGTTVLGAFDPIAEIDAVCKEFNLWHHVDGAYCGSVIFSNSYRHLVEGLEHSDSFSYNAHKMMGTPLTCSIVITRHRKSLYDSFAIDADYLYQTDKDDYNLGKTSLQCGRRNDALKFWTLWKAVGKKGLEAIVDQQFQLADAARTYIRNHPNYTLYSFDDSISICFNYKDIPANELCTALYQEGEIMVGFGAFRGQEFVRLVTVNSGNGEAQIQQFFQTLERFADRHFGVKS